MAKIIPEFGAYLSRLLDERNLSTRAVQVKTEVGNTIVADLRKGIVASERHIVKLAHGLGLDEEDLRWRAGFLPNAGSRMLTDWLAYANSIVGARVPMNLSHEDGEISPARAREIIRSLVEELRKDGHTLDEVPGATGGGAGGGASPGRPANEPKGGAGGMDARAGRLAAGGLRLLGAIA